MSSENKIWGIVRLPGKLVLPFENHLTEDAKTDIRLITAAILTGTSLCVATVPHYGAGGLVAGCLLAIETYNQYKKAFSH